MIAKGQPALWGRNVLEVKALAGRSQNAQCAEKRAQQSPADSLTATPGHSLVTVVQAKPCGCDMTSMRCTYGKTAVEDLGWFIGGECGSGHWSGSGREHGRSTVGNAK